MGLNYTGKDTDCAGYAAIAVAAGLEVGEAFRLARDLDRATVYPHGQGLAQAIHDEAKRLVAQRSTPA